MLFGFRGIRSFQVVLAIAALATGIGATVIVKALADGASRWQVIPALFLGLVFIWCFTTALRLPTSFVAVADERTRIRFGGFVDTVIDNRSITGVRVKKWNPLGGLGLRTNFGGEVALVSAWGEVAEVWLRDPIRVWLVPRLIPLRAKRLTLSIRNPQKLADRFGAPTPQSSRPARAGKVKHRGSRTR